MPSCSIFPAVLGEWETYKLLLALFHCKEAEVERGCPLPRVVGPRNKPVPLMFILKNLGSEIIIVVPPTKLGWAVWEL